MKRPLLPLLLSVVALASPSFACMNDYVPNVAAIERSKFVLDQLQKHVEKEPWEDRRDRLRKELAAGGDYKVKNDLATALAHTGEAAEAVTLLEQIEVDKPGLYVTAANLGTAYELSGNDEQALEWIRKGIERNPDSHEGTEWLHVRILKAKLALKNDPKWLESHSIVDPDKVIGTVGISATGNRKEKLSTEQIKSALIYQLHERLQFVPPPDAIVGALLLDLGQLLSLEASGLGGAKDVFRQAALYLENTLGTERLYHTAESRAHVAAMRQAQGSRSPIKAVIFLIFGNPISAAGILSLIAIALKRWIQRRLIAKTAQGAS